MQLPRLWLLEVVAIAKGRFIPRQQDTQKRLRVNEFIRVSQVFLVDENNEKVGILDTPTARQRAVAAGLDLVEVAPQANPPVCRIMDYGKWKYQQRKKEQKARSHSKQSELKEVRLRPKIDPHDLEIKLAKATEFLEEGHKVQFTMLFRGREMAHRELGMKVMSEVTETLAHTSKVEAPPRMMGKRMTMMLAPERTNLPKPTRSNEQDDDGGDETAASASPSAPGATPASGVAAANPAAS